MNCKIIMLWPPPPYSPFITNQNAYKHKCWCPRVDCVTITLVVVVVMVPIRTSHCQCVDNASVDNQQWQDRTLDKRLLGNFRLWVSLIYVYSWKLLSRTSSCFKRDYEFVFVCILYIVDDDNLKLQNRRLPVLGNPSFFGLYQVLEKSGIILEEYRGKNHLHPNKLHGKIVQRNFCLAVGRSSFPLI